MTLKDGYGFGGFSGTPPSEPNLSTPPPPPRGPTYTYTKLKKNPTPGKERKLNDKLLTLHRQDILPNNFTSSYAPQAPVPYPSASPRSTNLQHCYVPSSQLEVHPATTQPNILLPFYNPS